MKVLGIYGSPRKGGNTDLLLDEALRGASYEGAEITRIRCCDLRIEGCLECGGCDETGECIIEDDMQSVYPELVGSQVIYLASPIFFYGITSQAKALVDRCQALWCRRRANPGSGSGASLWKGHGYLLAVGATKGKNLFEGVNLVAKYFYDALNITYGGGVLVKSVEHKGDILAHPDLLKQAYDLGKASVVRRESP